MKTWDWEKFIAQGHRPEWVKWMKENYTKPISEEEFMAAYRALRKIDNRPYKARRYSTSTLRDSYRRLKDTFGFFI